MKLKNIITTRDMGFYVNGFIIGFLVGAILGIFVGIYG